MSSSWLVAALALTSLQSFEAVEPHMGTLVRITLYANNEQQAQSAFRAAFERITQLDNELSDYKPDSELNRLSRVAIEHWVPVGDDLFQVLETAQALAARTDGAFDITVGPLTHLWRECRKQNRLPGSAELQAALSRCGFVKLHLNPSDRTVRFDEPNLQLDAGGIAKGFAADEALKVLQDHGIRSALVAVSGDLAFSDAPPGRKGWRIGLEPSAGMLMLANAAVSTSGDDEQHIDVNGKRYSHILNPKTGMGLTNHLTATVIARRGIDADPSATAISVLGCKNGLAFVESNPKLAALLADGTNTIESQRFRKMAHE